MKRIVFALLLGMVLPISALAEEPVKIFDAADLSKTFLNPLSGISGEGDVDYTKLWTFAQKEISITCGETYTVKLSEGADGGGSVIVDNIMTVNDQNVCGMGDLEGISNAPYDNSRSCFIYGNTAGSGPIQPAGFGGIGVVDITALVDPGQQILTFALKDFGVVYGNTSIYLNAVGCTINDSQGCSPGYWKNHLGSWEHPVYMPGKPISEVFAVGLGGDLLSALSFKGGPGVEGAVRILLRSAVAALLNGSSGIGYPIWSAQLILDVNTAIASGNRETILALADTLDLNNNLGCPLN